MKALGGNQPCHLPSCCRSRLKSIAHFLLSSLQRACRQELPATPSSNMTSRLYQHGQREPPARREHNKNEGQQIVGLVVGKEGAVELSLTVADLAELRRRYTISGLPTSRAAVSRILSDSCWRQHERHWTSKSVPESCNIFQGTFTTCLEQSCTSARRPSRLSIVRQSHRQSRRSSSKQDILSTSKDPL